MMESDSVRDEARRVLSLTREERETELRSWVTKNCQLTAAKLDMEVAHRMLELYGVNVLVQYLTGSNLSGKPFSVKGYSDLYAITHSLCHCVRGYGPSAQRVYDGFTAHIENYLNDVVLPYLTDKRDYVLLKEFSGVWDRHCLLTRWMYKLYMQIDKSRSLYAGRKSITATSLNCFYRIVFGEVRERVQACVLHHIGQERDGVATDRLQLKSCVEMFILMGMASSVCSVASVAEAEQLTVDLSVYCSELETPFLNASVEYYARQRELWINDCDMLGYIAHVDHAVRTEQARVKAYLNDTTLPKILKITLQELMLEPLDRVKESFAPLLRSGDLGLQFDCQVYPENYCGNLKMLFSLVMQVQELPSSPGVDSGVLMNSLVSAFDEYLLEWADKILSLRKSQVSGSLGSSGGASEDGNKTSSPAVAAAADFEFITNCLNFYRRSSNLIVVSFQSSVGMKQCLVSALTVLMNADNVGSFGKAGGRETTPTEMLMTYLDRLLKKDSKAKAASDLEMDQLLSDAVFLFKSIRDKDVFAELYKDALAKRLLANKSASTEEEKSLIVKLKVAQGANFTARLEGMLVDISSAEISKREFDGRTGDQFKNCFSARVLSSNWKLSASKGIVVPAVMRQWIDAYNEYYLSTHPKMVLTWLFKTGETVVKLTHKGRSFDLVTIPVQALVLLLFDSRAKNQELNFEKITEMTGITEVEILKRVLHSLSCPNAKVKVPLLVKSPNTSRHINENDSFRFNDNFNSPLKKVAIPIASLDVDTSVTRSVDKAVEESRRFVLEACIVRIMKARKVLSHVELVSEVMRQVISFRPQPKPIKAVIESLIEREYLERHDNNSKMYNYLA